MLSLASFALFVAVALHDRLVGLCQSGPVVERLLSGLCRMKEAADQLGVLFAGAALDARGDIDRARRP